MPRRQSTFEDLIDIAARLHWGIGVAGAGIGYWVFHHFASRTVAAPAVTDPRKMATAVLDTVPMQLLIALSGWLQYLVPAAFLIGTLVSFLRRQRQTKDFERVAGTGGSQALNDLSWQAFEGLTAEWFRRKGYVVKERGGRQPDGGVDLEVRLGKDKYLVQCKHWKTSKVGVRTVRELYGAMAAEKAVGGFVVASGRFTAEAQRFVEGRAIELVSALDIHQSSSTLAHIEPSRRVEPAVDQPRTPSCPRCQATMALRVAKQGALAGSSFWGCTRFPECRGTIQSELVK